MAKSNNATSGNFLDGGNGRNVGLTNDLYDLQEFAKKGELGIMTQGTAMTAAEAEAEMARFHAQNEAERASAVSDVNKQSAWNVGLNLGGMALSAVSGSSALKAAKAAKAGGMAGKAAAATKAGALSKAADAVKKSVSKLGSKISGSAVGQSVKAGMSKFSKTAVGSFLSKGASKVASIGKGIKNAVRGVGGVTDDVAKSALGLSDDASCYFIKGAADGTKTAVLKGSNLTFKVAGEAGKETFKASVLGTLKTTFKNAFATVKGSKNVLGAIGNVGKASAQVAVGTAQAAGALASKFFMAAGATKTGVFGKMCRLVEGAAGVGLVTAPILTTQMITRSISDEKTAELNGAIAVLTDTCEYYEKQGDKLTEQQQSDYAALLAHRDESHAALLEKYGQYIDEDGNFSDAAAKAAFYEDYKNVEQSCADILAEQSASWKDFAVETTGHGVAMNMAGSMTENRAGVDATMDASSYVSDKVQSDPDALDKAYEGEAINKQLAASGDSGGFWGFISSVHNTILHYLPVVAYAEAAIKKGVDVVLGALPIGYEAKYAGQGIGDLASSISDNAEAEYELNKERKAIIRECDDESGVSFDRDNDNGGETPSLA